jgi:hypothetical protein
MYLHDFLEENNTTVNFKEGWVMYLDMLTICGVLLVDLITKTHPALFPLHRWTNTEDFYGRSTTAPRERAPGSRWADYEVLWVCADLRCRNLGSAADVRCRNALHWRKIGSYVNTDEHRLGPGKGSRLWARRVRECECACALAWCRFAALSSLGHVSMRIRAHCRRAADLIGTGVGE